MVRDVEKGKRNGEFGGSCGDVYMWQPRDFVQEKERKTKTKESDGYWEVAWLPHAR